MNSASSQTYTTWPGSKSTGTPQVKEVRDTHRSCKPPSQSMKLFTISWTRLFGSRKPVFSSRSRTRPAYLDARKK